MDSKKKNNYNQRKKKLINVKDIKPRDVVKTKRFSGLNKNDNYKFNSSSTNIASKYMLKNNNKKSNKASKNDSKIKISLNSVLIPNNKFDEYKRSQDNCFNHKTITSYYSKKTFEQPNFIPMTPSLSQRSNRCNTIENKTDIYRFQPKTPKPTITFKSYKDKTFTSYPLDRRTPMLENSNSLLFNNLTCSIRCPYCNHVLNLDKINARQSIGSIDFNKTQNIIKPFFEDFDGALRFEKKEILKNEKYDPRNFYVDEKGVTIFKPRERTSIVILNSKPNFTRYQEKTKIFGHSKNISIYESPSIETKVIVRPIKPKK